MLYSIFQNWTRALCQSLCASLLTHDIVPEIILLSSIRVPRYISRDSGSRCLMEVEQQLSKSPNDTGWECNHTFMVSSIYSVLSDMDKHFCITYVTSFRTTKQSIQPPIDRQAISRYEIQKLDILRFPLTCEEWHRSSQQQEQLRNHSDEGGVWVEHAGGRLWCIYPAEENSVLVYGTLTPASALISKSSRLLCFHVDIFVSAFSKIFIFFLLR